MIAASFVSPWPFLSPFNIWTVGYNWTRNYSLSISPVKGYCLCVGWFVQVLTFCVRKFLMPSWYLFSRVEGGVICSRAQRLSMNKPGYIRRFILTGSSLSVFIWSTGINKGSRSWQMLHFYCITSDTCRSRSETCNIQCAPKVGKEDQGELI